MKRLTLRDCQKDNPNSKKPKRKIEKQSLGRYLVGGAIGAVLLTPHGVNAQDAQVAAKDLTSCIGQASATDNERILDANGNVGPVVKFKTPDGKTVYGSSLEPLIKLQPGKKPPKGEDSFLYSGSYIGKNGNPTYYKNTLNLQGKTVTCDTATPVRSHKTFGDLLNCNYNAIKGLAWSSGLNCAKETAVGDSREIVAGPEVLLVPQTYTIEPGEPGKDAEGNEKPKHSLGFEALFAQNPLGGIVVNDGKHEKFTSMVKMKQSEFMFKKDAPTDNTEVFSLSFILNKDYPKSTVLGTNTLTLTAPEAINDRKADILIPAGSTETITINGNTVFQLAEGESLVIDEDTDTVIDGIFGPFDLVVTDAKKEEKEQKGQEAKKLLLKRNHLNLTIIEEDIAAKTVTEVEGAKKVYTLSLTPKEGLEPGFKKTFIINKVDAFGTKTPVELTIEVGQVVEGLNPFGDFLSSSSLEDVSITGSVESIRKKGAFGLGFNYDNKSDTFSARVKAAAGDGVVQMAAGLGLKTEKFEDGPFTHVIVTGVLTQTEIDETVGEYEIDGSQFGASGRVEAISSYDRMPIKVDSAFLSALGFTVTSISSDGEIVEANGLPVDGGKIETVMSVENGKKLIAVSQWAARKSSEVTGDFTISSKDRRLNIKLGGGFEKVSFDNSELEESNGIFFAELSGFVDKKGLYEMTLDYKKKGDNNSVGLGLKGHIQGENTCYEVDVNGRNSTELGASGGISLTIPNSNAKCKIVDTTNGYGTPTSKSSMDKMMTNTLRTVNESSLGFVETTIEEVDMPEVKISVEGTYEVAIGTEFTFTSTIENVDPSYSVQFNIGGEKVSDMTRVGETNEFTGGGFNPTEAGDVNGSVVVTDAAGNTIQSAEFKIHTPGEVEPGNTDTVFGFEATYAGTIDTPFETTGTIVDAETVASSTVTFDGVAGTIENTEGDNYRISGFTPTVAGTVTVEITTTDGEGVVTTETFEVNTPEVEVPTENSPTELAGVAPPVAVTDANFSTTFQAEDLDGIASGSSVVKDEAGNTVDSSLILEDDGGTGGDKIETFSLSISKESLAGLEGQTLTVETTIVDKTGKSEVKTFNVSVQAPAPVDQVNNAPVATIETDAAAYTTTTVGDTTTVNYNFTDADGDTVYTNVTGLPPEATTTYNPETGEGSITWTSNINYAGVQYDVTIEGFDANSASDSITFSTTAEQAPETLSVASIDFETNGRKLTLNAGAIENPRGLIQLKLVLVGPAGEETEKFQVNADQSLIVRNLTSGVHRTYIEGLNTATGERERSDEVTQDIQY